MASEVKRSINLEYQADLKQLIAQLEKMPGITAQEAKKMVSVLDTNFRRAEKAAKRSQEASKKAAREAQRAFQEIDTRGAEAGLEAVSDASGEVDSTLAALGGTLGTIAPEFGELTGFVGDTAAAVEALTALGGNIAKMAIPVVAALIAMSAAYHDLAGDVEEAEEKIRASGEALADMQAATEGFREKISFKQLELEVALGNERVETLEQQKAIMEAQALTSQRLEALDAERMEAQKQFNEAQTKYNQDLEKAQDLTAVTSRLTSQMVVHHDDLERKQVRLNSLNSQSAALREETLSLASDILLVKQKENEEAELAKQQEAARKAFAEQTRREEELRLAALEAQAELQEILASANRDLLSESEKAIVFADEQLDKIQEIEDLTGQTLELEQARSAVIQRMGRDLKAIEAKELAEANEQLASVVDFMEDIPDEAQKMEAALSEMADKLRATFLELAASIAAPFQEIFQGVMSLSSELMGLTLDRLTQSQSEITEINDQIAKAGSKSQVDALKEERRIALEAIKDQKARATEQFKVNKSLRIAEAIMGTASAAAQALASPPGPPTTIPLAALAAALGAVQIARIANEQPSFHQGGMVTGLQPDERSAVLRTGEGVLTAQGVAAAGGPAGVNALNQGGAGGQPLTVVFTASNRVMDSAVYNAMRSGSQLRSVTRDLRPRGRKNIYRQQARI
jgi:hypothetical protein